MKKGLPRPGMVAVARNGRGKRRKKGAARIPRRLLWLGGPFLLLLLLLALCVLPGGAARPSGEKGGMEAGLFTDPGKKAPSPEKKVPSPEPWNPVCRILDGKGRARPGLPLVAWMGGEAFPAKTDRAGRFRWPSREDSSSLTWIGLDVFLPGGPKESFLVNRKNMPARIVVDPPLHDLSGRILPGGGIPPSEIQGAGIAFLEIPGGRILAEAKTGPGGMWRARLPGEIPLAAVLVRARSSSGDFLGAWFLGELAAKEIRLASGRIPLRVSILPHPPPPGSRILAAPRFSRDPILAEKTWEKGSPLVLRLPPGPVQVLLLGPQGECLGEETFTAGRGEGLLRLGTARGGGTRLEGKVLGPEGRPVEGARVVFFPLSLRGRKSPLPPEEDWNPFLAARVRVEGVADREGRFLLSPGPVSRGLLRVADRASRAERALAVDLPRKSPLLVRLEEGASLEIPDLGFEQGAPPSLLSGGLRWSLFRKGGGRVEKGRVRCLPWVLSRLEPGDWVLRLEGGGRKARLDLRLLPGRALRLKPVLR